MYLKETGPWMGAVYGNADRIVEESPKYAELYNGERATLSDRKEQFVIIRDSLQHDIDVEMATGTPHMPIVIARRTAIVDLNRRMRNPVLSGPPHVPPYPPGPPARPDAVDNANNKLVTTQADLATEKATYLPSVPVFRQIKARRMEKAARHKEWKTNLANNIKNSTFGTFRYEDYVDKVNNLLAEIDAEMKRPVGSRNEELIVKNRKAIKDLEGTLSWTDEVVHIMHGQRAI